MNRRSFVSVSAAIGASTLLSTDNASAQATPDVATPVAETLVSSGYAPVNGLEMYYEVHGSGSGTPVVLLHGGLATIEWPNGPFMRELAATRTVYAVEFQSHGHTANIDRPFTFENLRDDVIAFIRFLELDQVDVVGFSVGGVVAIGVAISAPELVRKIVPISASITTQGSRQENIDAVAGMSVDVLIGSPMEVAYKAVAPDPEDFASTAENISTVQTLFKGWAEADVQAYPAPTMIVIGDSDAIRLDETIAFFRLRGGDVNADFVGEPANRLAILPGPGHFGFMMYVSPLIAVIQPWLDLPVA